MLLGQVRRRAAVGRGRAGRLADRSNPRRAAGGWQHSQFRYLAFARHCTNSSSRMKRCLSSMPMSADASGGLRAPQGALARVSAGARGLRRMHTQQPADTPTWALQLLPPCQAECTNCSVCCTLLLRRTRQAGGDLDDGCAQGGANSAVQNLNDHARAFHKTTACCNGGHKPSSQLLTPCQRGHDTAVATNRCQWLIRI